MLSETNCYHCHKATKYGDLDIVMETSSHEKVVRCEHCGGLVIVLEDKKERR